MRLKKNLIYFIYTIPFILYLTDYNYIGLYIIIPLLFIYLLITQKINPLRSSCFRLYFILCGWILLMIPFAYNVELAIQQIKPLVGSMILTYITYILAYKKPTAIYITYIIFWFGLLYYGFTNLETLKIAELDKFRLNDDKLNANTLAYFTFYSTFASFILYEKANSYKNLYKILFIITILMTFILPLYTASRQILIIQIPLIISLLFIKFFKLKKKNIAMLVSLIIIGFLVGSYYYNNYYSGSYLYERTTLELKEDNRYYLLKEAFNVGINNIITGVGPRNFILFNKYNAFSHSTYLELFANVGIVGITLYTIMTISFIIIQYRRYLNTKKPIFIYFIVFGIFFIIDNVFFVFHDVPYLMAFFFLIYSHSNYLYFNEKHHYSHI